MLALKKRHRISDEKHILHKQFFLNSLKIVLKQNNIILKLLYICNLELYSFLYFFSVH